MGMVYLWMDLRRLLLLFLCKGPKSKGPLLSKSDGLVIRMRCRCPECKEMCEGLEAVFYLKGPFYCKSCADKARSKCLCLLCRKRLRSMDGICYVCFYDHEHFNHWLEY